MPICIAYVIESNVKLCLTNCTDSTTMIRNDKE